MHVQVCACGFTHYATHHFEGATLASEKTPDDGIHDVPQHVEEIY